MEKPLVTVVTVTYNSSAYVRDAIESVLLQGYSNIEYIIGDDCSGDDTWAIIQEYRDPRIKAYRNETNLGEYPNRNKAIDIARGRYLIFIDGDDVMLRHGIDVFVNMMEAFPDAGMAIQRNYNNSMLYPALLQPKEIIKNYFYGKSNFLSSSFASNFFKTNLLKKWKLATRYKTGDEVIRLTIAAHFPVLIVAGWLTWPRETPGQASSSIGMGIGIAENYLISKEILDEPELQYFGTDLLEDMGNQNRKRAGRFVLYLLARGKWGILHEFFKKTGLTFKDAFKFYSYKPRFHDALEDYSPSKPFKKNHLSKHSTE